MKRLASVYFLTTKEEQRLFDGSFLDLVRLKVFRARKMAAMRLHVKTARMIRIKLTRENDRSISMDMTFTDPFVHEWRRGGTCAMPGCDRKWKDHTVEERIVR